MTKIAEGRKRPSLAQSLETIDRDEYITTLTLSELLEAREYHQDQEGHWVP